MAKACKGGAKAKEPEVGSDEWYAREQAKPGFALAEMRDLCQGVARGPRRPWGYSSGG